jgi:hypothetical protein
VDRAEDQQREEDEREDGEDISEATHEGKASCDAISLQSTKPMRPATAQTLEKQFPPLLRRGAMASRAAGGTR